MIIFRLLECNKHVNFASSSFYLFVFHLCLLYLYLSSFIYIFASPLPLLRSPRCVAGHPPERGTGYRRLKHVIITLHPLFPARQLDE
jgi:hypothetical protein